MSEPDKGRIWLLVGALRSGLYIKGMGCLHWLESPEDHPAGALPGTWCCLGVGGDVATRFGLDIPRTQAYAGTREQIGESGSYMDARVRQWYGFPALGGTQDNILLLKADGTPVLASVWNDDPDSTFEDIADGLVRTFLTPVEG